MVTVIAVHMLMIISLICYVIHIGNSLIRCCVLPASVVCSDNILKQANNSNKEFVTVFLNTGFASSLTLLFRIIG